jgi:hypothetical protein
MLVLIRLFSAFSLTRSTAVTEKLPPKNGEDTVLGTKCSTVSFCMLFPCLAYSLTLQMEVVRTSEVSVFSTRMYDVTFQMTVIFRNTTE